MKPDEIKRVAAAALAMAPNLLAEWVGGRQYGREWHAERKANGGLGDSWKINLDSGRWANFSGTETGGDLVDLYAALNHLNQGPAAEQVAQACGYSSDAPVLERTRLTAPQAHPAQQIPPDATDPSPHTRYGAPTAVYRYGDKFLIVRYDHAEGKHFAPFTWRDTHWVNRAYPSPRPLYNVAELAKYPDLTVLIVEGEKCVDAAKPLLRRNILITWAGGSGAVKLNDWTPLKGRDVTIWPDADHPGRKCAAELAVILMPIASRVRMVNPDRENGWDIADAVAEGWDGDKIKQYALSHIAEPTAPIKTPSKSTSDYIPKAEQSEDYENGSAPKSAIVSWQSIGLATDSKGVPHSTLSNTSSILQHHDEFRGKIWFDTFRDRIYHSIRGAPQPWTDIDSMRALAFVQQTLQLPKITLSTVHDAVAHAAHQYSRNSVQDWLNTLEWDGTPRLDTWVADCLGVELTEYSMAVSKNWPLSMVARALTPGCQVDTMPVLEGIQGKGKSSALAILGGEWYSACGLAFGDKEFLQTIQGKWLIEIPDMAGFGKREHSQVISCITTRSDYYRASYGRFAEDHPRKCVFAATSETDDYLLDRRGFRRYWPLRCGDINLDTLREQRDQIFAEAYQLRLDGVEFHDMPAASTIAEQVDRYAGDVWTEAVIEYLARLPPGEFITAARVLEYGLKVTIDRHDHAGKTRVGNILRAAGYVQRTVNSSRGWYKPIRQPTTVK